MIRIEVGTIMGQNLLRALQIRRDHLLEILKEAGHQGHPGHPPILTISVEVTDGLRKNGTQGPGRGLRTNVAISVCKHRNRYNYGSKFS